MTIEDLISLIHEDIRAIRADLADLLREHTEALARQGEMLEEILRRLPPGTRKDRPASP